MGGAIAEPLDRPADVQRGPEDPAYGQATLEAMPADRFESCRRDASAAGAIGVAAKLAGFDLALEV